MPLPATSPNARRPARLAVETDRPGTAAALHALAEVVQGDGGRVLEGTRFRAYDGDLTVHRAADAPAATPLIAVPTHCLPPTGAFRVRLVRGRFVWTRAADGPRATSVQERAFTALIELYNLLEKPRQWARQSPWLTLWSDPALLAHLAHADRLFGRPPELSLYQTGAWEALLVRSFFRSRVFALRDGKTGQKRDVLLPLLDALDHHAHAPQFRRHLPEPSAGPAASLLSAEQARPVPGCDACRVSYNVLDAQTALLHYGFLDTSAQYLLSVPAHLPLRCGLTLVVVGATGRYQDPLPAHREALRPWMPKLISAPPEVLAVTRLPLPPTGEVATLHGVLNLLVARKFPHWPASRRREAVAEAVPALLAANRRHHARTADLLAAARTQGQHGETPGRRATLAALEALVARADAHFACTTKV